MVRAAIGRLPARRRAVLVLRYHQDLLEQQVARLLRIPLGTVKSTTSRALARLCRDLARGELRADGGSCASPRGGAATGSASSGYRPVTGAVPAL